MPANQYAFNNLVFYDSFNDRFICYHLAGFAFYVKIQIF